MRIIILVGDLEVGADQDQQEEEEEDLHTTVVVVGQV